jgi:cytoskeletal protein RodZ
MLKNFRDKIAISGITVLMIGVALLIFTFISAYGFLTQSLSIIASQDLVQTFGDALAPLISTCIRIMYLGVMGWAGSLLTIRGVTIIAHTPTMPTVTPAVAQPQPQKPTIPQQKPLPQKPKEEKPREEKPQEEKPPETAKPPEPQMIVIPPEQISQPQPQQKPEETPKKDAQPQ